MGRLKPEQWDEIRQRWEAGDAVTDLAGEFGVSRETIHQHRTKEGWELDTWQLQERQALYERATATANRVLAEKHAEQREQMATVLQTAAMLIGAQVIDGLEELDPAAQRAKLTAAVMAARQADAMRPDAAGLEVSAVRSFLAHIAPIGALGDDDL